MLEQFKQMASELKEAAAGRQVVYIPNPGNFGDGLIRYGTKQFLADFGFDHSEVNVGYTRVRYQLLPWLVKDRLGEKAFFIYGGGGAWSPAYDFARTTCAFIDRVTPHYAVLPSTYALADLPMRGMMYRRDEGPSAEINPVATFCHDMALYTACREGAVVSWPDPAQRAGLFMRTDRESRFDGEVPEGNVDLSLEGDHMSNGDDFLNRVAAFETIYTDRLHVAIAGCITGRKVVLFTGNYFKIKAIHEASLADNFAGQVTLVEGDADPAEMMKAAAA